MNKQGKNGIGWCDWTWNPVTGCLHGCEYCYAERIAKRFSGKWTEDKGICITPPLGEGVELTEQLERKINGKTMKVAFPFGFYPTFHHYRLKEPARIKKPKKIFVCSMADLFGEWVPDEWIEEVFKACEAAPQNTYMFLTKNYKKASNFKYHDNWWIGKTITNNENSRLFEGDPWSVDGMHRANQFLSIEPIQGDISDLKYYLYSFKWIIIGAQTGPGAKPPKPEWVQSIINQAKEAGIPVFVKNPLYKRFPIQQWPEGLK